MSLKATVRQAGDVSIVDLAGRITLGEGSGLVRSTIKELVNSGHKNILLNLKEVSYIDSAGLGEMVGAYASVTNAQGSIKLLHPQSRCTTCFRLPSSIPCSSRSTTNRKLCAASPRLPGAGVSFSEPL